MRVCGHLLPLKQVRVRSGPRKPHFVVNHLVDQQPIRFDVALPVALPLSLQWMRPIRRWQRFAKLQFADNSDELRNVAAALTHALAILSKRRALDKELHAGGFVRFFLRGATSPNMSSTFAYRWSLDRVPAFSNSSIAFLVSAFGTRTSNGSPFRSTTCRRNIVIASVVLTPTVARTRAARALSFGSIRAVMYPVLPMSYLLTSLLYHIRDTLHYIVTSG